MSRSAIRALLVASALALGPASAQEPPLRDSVIAPDEPACPPASTLVGPGLRDDARMPRLQRKSLTSPDLVRPFTFGHVDVVNLDER